MISITIRQLLHACYNSMPLFKFMKSPPKSLWRRVASSEVAVDPRPMVRVCGGSSRCSGVCADRTNEVVRDCARIVHRSYARSSPAGIVRRSARRRRRSTSRSTGSPRQAWRAGSVRQSRAAARAPPSTAAAPPPVSRSRPRRAWQACSSRSRHMSSGRATGLILMNSRRSGRFDHEAVNKRTPVTIGRDRGSVRVTPAVMLPPPWLRIG